MGVKRFTDRWKYLYFPFFAKNGGKSSYLFYSKEVTTIALVYMMYDGSWTNNLLVVVLFHNWAMHIF